MTYRPTFVQRNQSRICDVRGCTKLRHHTWRHCRSHGRKARTLGSPLAKPRRAEVEVFVGYASELISKHLHVPQMRHAVDAMAKLIHHHRWDSDLSQHWIERLRGDSKATPHHLLARVVAVWLLRETRPLAFADDAHFDFTIASAVLRSIPLPVHISTNGSRRYARTPSTVSREVSAHILRVFGVWLARLVEWLNAVDAAERAQQTQMNQPWPMPTNNPNSNEIK